MQTLTSSALAWLRPRLRRSATARRLVGRLRALLAVPGTHLPVVAQEAFSLRLSGLAKDMQALSYRLASLEARDGTTLPLGPGLLLRRDRPAPLLCRAGGSVRPLPPSMEQRLAKAAPGLALDLAPGNGELALLLGRAGFTVEAFAADWPGHHLLCANLLLAGAAGITPRPPGTTPQAVPELALLHLGSWPPPDILPPATGQGRPLLLLDNAPPEPEMAAAGYVAEALAPAGPWLASPAR